MMFHVEGGIDQNFELETMSVLIMKYGVGKGFGYPKTMCLGSAQIHDGYTVLRTIFNE